MKKQKIKFMLTLAVISLMTTIFIPQPSLAGLPGIQVMSWGWLDDIPRWFREFWKAINVLSKIGNTVEKTEWESVINFISMCIPFIILLGGLYIIVLIIEFINSLRR